jgi:selenocysteine lyase/cysteine desulfurase
MISCQRHLFDLPPGLTYLNCAYMSPLMTAVAEAGAEGLTRKLHPWEIMPDDFFTESEKVRSLAAQLFQASADDIALIPSASYGISTAASNLPLAKGESILVLEEQFPSNYLPWQRIAEERQAEILTIPRPKDGNWSAAVMEHICDGVAVAALPAVQWTTGGRLDLESISTLCRKHGTALVLDLTQSLGVLPFDAESIQPDFAVAATYKWLLGPYSYGVMYVAPKWHGGKPLEENWIQRANARNFASLVPYTDRYEEGARRFDMGERANFALVPAVAQALQQILHWGVEEIASTLGGFTRQIAQRAAELGMETWPERWQAPHYLCLRTPTSCSKLVGALTAERIFVSVRGSSIRVTPHVYNSAEDIERFLSTLVQQNFAS